MAKFHQNSFTIQIPRPSLVTGIRIILSIVIILFTSCDKTITAPSGPEINSFQILYGIPWTESGTELIVTDTSDTDSVESHFSFKGSGNWLKPVDGKITYYDEPPTQVVGVITGSELSQTIIHFDGAMICCDNTSTVIYSNDCCSTDVWDSQYGKLRFEKSGSGEEVAYFLLSYGKYGFNRFSNNSENGIFTWITDLNGAHLWGKGQLRVYHHSYSGME